MAQAAIAFEEVAAPATYRIGADRGQLIASVRLVESAAGNADPLQPIQALEKLALAVQAANDQVRMRVFSGKKGSGNFDGCVTRLDDLLSNGEVRPNEEVNVWRLVLGKWHRLLLGRKIELKGILTPKCAEVKPSTAVWPYPPSEKIQTTDIANAAANGKMLRLPTTNGFPRFCHNSLCCLIKRPSPHDRRLGLFQEALAW